VNDTRRINTGFIELHVRKFVNGGGSTIRLAVCCSVFVRSNGTYDIFTHFPDPVGTVYATYDQGSTKLYPYLYPESLIPMPFTYILIPPYIVERSLGYRLTPGAFSSLYLGAVYFYLAQSIVIFFHQKEKTDKEKVFETNRTGNDEYSQINKE
jgi:hypothetical protein